MKYISIIYLFGSFIILSSCGYFKDDNELCVITSNIPPINIITSFSSMFSTDNDYSSNAGIYNIFRKEDGHWNRYDNFGFSIEPQLINSLPSKIRFDEIGVRDMQLYSTALHGYEFERALFVFVLPIYANGKVETIHHFFGEQVDKDNILIGMPSKKLLQKIGISINYVKIDDNSFYKYMKNHSKDKVFDRKICQAHIEEKTKQDIKNILVKIYHRAREDKEINNYIFASKKPLYLQELFEDSLVPGIQTGIRAKLK